MDPQRIGVAGVSAGGHLSLWVAMHDDVGNRKSEDTLTKLSLRVAFAISISGPTDWSVTGVHKKTHPAYFQLLGI